LPFIIIITIIGWYLIYKPVGIYTINQSYTLYNLIKTGSKNALNLDYRPPNTIFGHYRFLSSI